MNHYSTIFALLVLLLSPVSGAKVISIKDHGFIVENQIQVERPSAQSWLALVNDVGKWWPADHTWWGKAENLSIQTRAGGCFCEVDGEKSAEHMRISFVDPNKLLRMTGGLGPLQGMGMYGALDWQLKATDKGTQITLTYRVTGINPDGFAQLAPVVAHVQGLQLAGLGQYLNSQK